MDVFGKRVFFLYPHSVIQDELVYEIVKNEYEAYLIRDHKKIIQEMRGDSESILFINIDSTENSEQNWESYIKNIMNDDTLKVHIGIMTYNNDQQLAQKYLMDIGVPCGFIVLKLGLEQSKKIILTTLEANEARGQRKYVRANCSNSKSTLNVKYNNTLLKGDIADVSSVGLSCSFGGPVDIKKGMVLKNVQLILRGKIAMVDAVVLGQRELDDGGIMYVLLFSKTINVQEKLKIHRFIYETLQNTLNIRLGL